MRRAALRLATLGTVAAVAIVAAAALAPRGHSTPAGNTWAGVWNTDFGKTTLDAGGSGHYEGFNPGDLHGSVTGNVDKGTWTQPGDPPKEGTFTFTMSADGHSWSGVWAYKTGGCGSACGWNGTCISGPCMKNKAGGGGGGGSTNHCKQRTPQGRRAINEVRVVAVTPDVQWHCEGSADEEWLTVSRGTVLKAGDEISTDPDGSVTLAFADNSTVTLRNTTQLKIASFFTEGGVVRTEILLKMGEVSAKVNKSEATKSDFRIKQPTATASVRGTIFTVSYDRLSKVGVTSVQRGLVEVDPARAGLPTVMVPVGKEVAVTAKTETKVVAVGKAGTPPGAISRGAARKLVLAQVARSDEKCKLKVTGYGLQPAARGWLVSVTVSGGKRGTATWRVTGKKAAPANALAKTIAAGCKS